MSFPSRAIPSVDRVLRDLGETGLPRPAVVAVVRRELAAVRQGAEEPDDIQVLDRVRAALDDLAAARLRPLINATGIIIHTNFGRAPLGARPAAALTEIASAYSNLEFDLTGGARGGRAAYLEHNLAILCGAEAATAVNNCAAALVLILRHFCTQQRPQVVVSRGELVQIGGGFRIPEILESAGAVLREVGTTNKTTADDYAKAISPATAMVLKVHRSNFYMGGFVESPDRGTLADVAKAGGVPFIEDLGSGAMFPTDNLGSGGGASEREPTPAEVLRQGANLVCFSGDKLLGGPQAGVIAGAAAHIAALRSHPFFRALRCDKLILAALQETVDLHLCGEVPSADSQIPILRMMGLTDADLRPRAQHILASLTARGVALSASIGQGMSRVGGGALPRTIIPSVTIDLLPVSLSLEALAQRLRRPRPPLLPVVGYLADGRLKLDLRTVFLDQDEALLAAIAGALLS